MEQISTDKRNGLLMYLAIRKQARPVSIPMPKTTKFRAMRELKRTGYAYSSSGLWYITDKGLDYLKRLYKKPRQEVNIDLSDINLTLTPSRQFRIKPLPLIKQLI